MSGTTPDTEATGIRGNKRNNQIKGGGVEASRQANTSGRVVAVTAVWRCVVCGGVVWCGAASETPTLVCNLIPGSLRRRQIFTLPLSSHPIFTLQKITLHHSASHFYKWDVPPGPETIPYSNTCL